MTRARLRRKTFVERHGLWTDDQTRAANAVVQAIKRHKTRTRPLFLRGSARRAARQDRDGRRRAGAAARRRHDDHDAARQGHRAQDRVAGVHAAAAASTWRRCRAPVISSWWPDPATFRVLPWAQNTGWLLCDIYFTNGKPVPFSTRRVLRDALARLGRRGLRFPRRSRSRIPSVQAGEPASCAGRCHLAAARARGEPAQPGLSVSHREPLRSDRRRLGRRSGAASLRSACRCARSKSSSGRASANSPSVRRPASTPPTR